MSRPRRWFAPAVVALAAGGGLTFVTMRQTWATAELSAAGLPDDEIIVTGAEAMPVVSALALVLLASALAVLAGSVRVRRVLGVLVAGIAMALLVWVAFGSESAIGAAVDDAVRDSASFTGTNHPEGANVTMWRLATLACLALAALAGVVIAWFAPRWPTMSSRYDAPGTRAAERDESDMWKAFDEGRDPTE
ncbi:Trp biosynthesis-associated membrane protein [uncultured Aeromicrobium sp.]|uniref:Trp biosynthesis-associated membrane protein n=1 Tax=uncultured Aeromicrobium sp. TaxID=337820 RepID=UPI0025EBD5C5|nr:Trp biosynthesis-associated membrane protein [uncultured Aeromicrobium sp.]